MTALETRKQLLIVESELNRAQLTLDVAALKAGARAAAVRAQSFASLASAVAALVSGLVAFRRGKAADGGAKPSWLRRVLKGAGLMSTLWMAFRSSQRDQKTK